MTADSEPLEIAFDRSTVELDALQRAAYAVAHVMTVNISTSPDGYSCRVFPRNQHSDSAEIAHQLRSEVIDQTLRLRIAAETEPLRNLVFALAFSQTGLSDNELPES
jgi:His-Xaa-Ser system protein HxsD